MCSRWFNFFSLFTSLRLCEKHSFLLDSDFFLPHIVLQKPHERPGEKEDRIQRQKQDISPPVDDNFADGEIAIIIHARDGSLFCVDITVEPPCYTVARLRIDDRRICHTPSVLPVPGTARPDG